MVKLELLSDNLTIILNELLNSQEVAKYLTYPYGNAIERPNVTLPAKSLMMKNVFPYPFNPKIQTEDCSQIRVYYPDGEIDDSEAWLDTDVFFDIVVAKTLWLVSDSEREAIRPYEILRYLIEHFKDRSIGTVGKLKFSRFVHLNVNENFDAIRIGARMLTV